MDYFVIFWVLTKDKNSLFRLYHQFPEHIYSDVTNITKEEVDTI